MNKKVSPEDDLLKQGLLARGGFAICKKCKRTFSVSRPGTIYMKGCSKCSRA
jgi:hypothetical protein